jgi:predicted MFS family arabinose efflux permease
MIEVEPVESVQHREDAAALTSGRLRRARYAVMAMFFTWGMVYATWGLQIPSVERKFALSPGWLSLALFAVAGGSIVALMRVGPWVARVGSRTASRVGGMLVGSSAALIMLPPAFPLLLAVLVLYGVGNAIFDVALNDEGSAIEAALARPVMSSLHGMFSAGGMAGAALGGELLARGMGSALHLSLAGALLAAVSLTASCTLIPTPARPRDAQVDADSDGVAAVKTPDRSDPGRARFLLWALGIVALIALIAEGAMYDWSAVYLRDVIHADPRVTGLAYATFSGGMALGRFCGDWLRAHSGRGRLMGASGLFGAIGMSAALLVRQPIVVLVGFGMMGLGLANMIPLLFGAAAAVPGVPRAVGIARVAGVAYVGLLIGPVLIGLAAQAFGLPDALALVAGCALIVAAVAPRILRAKTVRSSA